MIRSRSLCCLALLFACAGPLPADDGERQIFAVVDAGGNRRFTSDPAAAADAVAVPDSEEPAPEAGDAQSVAASLRDYVKSQSSAGWAAEKLAFLLSVSPDVPPAEDGDRDPSRAAADRVELLLNVEAILTAPERDFARSGLARLVFPALRSIYPNAFLSVTVHDGLRTLSRADWEPQHLEPLFRVQ